MIAALLGLCLYILVVVAAMVTVEALRMRRAGTRIEQRLRTIHLRGFDRPLYQTTENDSGRVVYFAGDESRDGEAVWLA